MTRSTFIPAPDTDFWVWYEHSSANLTPEKEVSETESKKAVNADFHEKTGNAGNATAVGKLPKP